MNEDYIRASDGNGPAVVATITSDRPVGSLTIIVDSVLNWPHKGIATAGTPTYDSDNNLTYLTDTTVFRYHLDGSIIEIEGFAPGYSDTGNVIDQVVIMKDSTEWANAVSDRVNAIEKGATWYNDLGVPDNALGLDGDYYIDDTTNDVYNKVSGDWGSPITNLTGATGAKIVSADFNGDDIDFLLSDSSVATLPDGKTDLTGPVGPGATITIGNVDTVAWDDPASVTNSGTPTSAILDFDIPGGYNPMTVSAIQPASPNQGDLWYQP